ncbi:MAG: chemotaxis protein CheW [Mariprofundus sp.]|nr:chemotaxis protein CheW [Mariprofundus sp.]
MNQASVQLLYFHISDMRFCVDLCQTSKVVPLVALQQMPDSPDYLAGVMDLHGACVPIIDLVYRLNLSCQDHYQLTAAIVLCEISGNTVGFIVDEVESVGMVELASVQLRSLLDCSSPPLRGMVDSGRGMVAWLALERILAIDFSLPDADLVNDYHAMLHAVRQ